MTTNRCSFHYIEMENCKECKGKGYILVPISGFNNAYTEKDCATCNGKGEIKIIREQNVGK